MAWILRDLLSLNYLSMFEKKYHYDAVSPAVERLKDQGYTLDFNLDGNYLIAEDEKIPLDDVRVTDLFHFENESDLSDDSIVYAVLSKDGTKGFLVSGLGMYTEEVKDRLEQALV